MDSVMWYLGLSAESKEHLLSGAQGKILVSSWLQVISILSNQSPEKETVTWGCNSFSGCRMNYTDFIQEMYWAQSWELLFSLGVFYSQSKFVLNCPSK